MVSFLENVLLHVSKVIKTVAFMSNILAISLSSSVFSIVNGYKEPDGETPSGGTSNVVLDLSNETVTPINVTNVGSYSPVMLINRPTPWVWLSSIVTLGSVQWHEVTHAVLGFGISKHDSYEKQYSF